MLADIRFVREDDDEEESWEDRVAKNYESKLFREYALVSRISFSLPSLCTPFSLLLSSLKCPSRSFRPVGSGTLPIANVGRPCIRGSLGELT